MANKTLRTRIVDALAGKPATDYESVTNLALRMKVLVGDLAIRAFVENGRIVFTGGSRGAHSLAIDVSSRERIVAHFLGYLVANGFEEPQVGDVVRFRSKSAWRGGGTRTGRVVERTSSRVRVAYKFKHGGEAAPVWIAAWDVVVRGRAKSERAA